MDLFFLLLTSPSQISLFALLFLSHVGHSGAAQHHWRSLTVRGRDWIQPANDTTMKHRGHFLRQYGDSSHRLLVTDENQQKAEGKGEEAELESSRTFTETECLDQRIFRRGSSERCKKGKCRSDWLHWPNDCTIRWTTMMTTTTTCLQQQL